MFRRLLLSTCAISTLPLSTLAIAQTESTYHDHATDIVVTALIPRKQEDMLSGTSVISGERLTRVLRPTIGETLAHQPGVSATSFGPNASRPVLRGFQGERVRILTDGIGSFDVSNTSVDHAVAINPLTADRIEILRGPAALIYGSSAIGGVVNVIDSRIPRQIPDEPIHIDSIATYGSASNERTLAAELEIPLGGGFVAHADGTWTKTGDMRTGGYILSKPIRDEAWKSHDPEIRAQANRRGKLDNTAARVWEAAGGVAYVGTNGNLGLSVSHTNNRYGVPSRIDVSDDHAGHDHDHSHDDHGHDDVTLAMRQTRADLRAEVDTGGGFLSAIKFRTGWANYRHDEIEPSGEVGTTFRNQSLESRLELIQAKRGAWDGASGIQFMTRRFTAVGEEKFLPRNQTDQFGLFTLQALDLGRTKLEAGARFEHSRLQADADNDLYFDGARRSYNAFSGSLGISQVVSDGWRVGLNASRSERAPSAEELFARGNHAGTQSFELGNADFKKEQSWGLEATVRGEGTGYGFSLSAYHNWFKNFIYEGIVSENACLAANGGHHLEFPCFQYAQADARYLGFEMEVNAKLGQIGRYDLLLDGIADYVRATIKGTGPAPRIPPLRLLGGVTAKDERMSLRGEVEHSFAQRRISELETPTDGFTLVNASLTWVPLTNNSRTTITLSANNIFDVDARRHASVLKDFAPLSGRDVRITARLSI